MTKLEIEGLGEIELPEAEARFVDYRGYRGFALLKRAGVKIEWTSELVTEYKKCSEDPIYFVETYMRVVHVDRGLVPFKLYPYQKQLIQNIHNNRFTITTMARQSGKSTAVIAYLLWFVLFNSYKTVLILANKAETAREILGKAALAYLHLPKHIQQGVTDWNKGSLMFENGSRAVALSTSDVAARGYAANILVIDEAAHIERWEAFAQSTLPIVSSGETTKIAMISTPSGLNHFYAYWSKAQLYNVPADKIPPNMKWNGYVPLMVRWPEVPGRDEKWREKEMMQMNFDQQKFDQEYNCDFIGSSGTLIAGWKLKELAGRIPLYHKDGLYKYVEPKPDHLYIMTCDVSEGKGFDYSTFQITDIRQMPYEQVAVFRSNTITPGDFSEIMYRTAKAYNNAAVLIEYESLGPVVAYDLFNNLEYENILFTKAMGRLGKQITHRNEPQVDLGIKMTTRTKSEGCSMLKLLVEQNQYIINDQNTIEELARFIRDGKSYAAEEGTHDDLVMPLVIFGWLSNQQYFRDINDLNTLTFLRDKKTEDIEEDLMPFGFVLREPQGVMPSTANLHRELWITSRTNMNPVFSPYVRPDERDNDEDDPVNF
jgi:hypothetical protein